MDRVSRRNAETGEAGGRVLGRADPTLLIAVCGEAALMTECWQPEERALHG